MQDQPILNLRSHSTLIFKQRWELAEFLGFETRNKYEILAESGQSVGFAAEQRDGGLGFLLRQVLGHWRTFTLHFFRPDRTTAFVATHPFRFLFQRLEIATAGGKPLGALQQRFAILSKRFDVLDAAGNVVLETNSPLWSPWTFKFLQGDRERAVVRKKWSGLFSEASSDRDNFQILFSDPAMREEERCMILASALFIDLIYFERKAKR
jgi:uncharacterized protein YxjI